MSKRTTINHAAEETSDKGRSHDRSTHLDEGGLLVGGGGVGLVGQVPGVGGKSVVTVGSRGSTHHVHRVHKACTHQITAVSLWRWFVCLR